MTDAGISSSYDRPLEYRICVQGVLDSSWSARLGGLQIDVLHSENRVTTTVLSGTLEDQASLNGVLVTLYGLGFRLLSVTAL